MSTAIRLDAPPANDNGAPPETRNQKPVVSVAGGRPEQAYACSGNLILPLRFARRLAGWQISPLTAS
jgi:hypothetical protein